MSTPWRLRPMRLGDLGRVLELEPALFGPSAWSRATYLGELDGPDRQYLAAVDQADTLVGWAGIAHGEVTQVMTVGVDPAWRRRGVATAMLAALVRAAADAGAAEVMLEVRASDRGAQRLYEGAGFAAVGLRANYYAHEQEDAVVMRRALSPGGARAEGGPAPG